MTVLPLTLHSRLSGNFLKRRNKLLDSGIALSTDCLELNRNRCLESIYIFRAECY